MSSRLLILLILTISAGISRSDASVENGTLCIEGSECVSSSSMALTVEPSEVPRSFVWARADGRVAILGAVSPGETRIPLKPEGSASLYLSSKDPGRWPSPTKLSVQSSSTLWHLDLSANQVNSPIELRMRRDEYELSLESTGHQRLSRQVIVGNEAVHVRLALEPLPRISGRIVSRSGREPVPGAAVSIGQSTVAISDGTGRFKLDAHPDDWPAAIRVDAAGYAPADVAVPRARVSADLLDIVISEGSSIIVQIDRPEEIQTLRVDLYKRSHDVVDESLFASRSLEADARSVRFDGIEAGDYVVLA